MQVRAKATHTQPGTHFYREEGDEFTHQGKIYKHVEAVQSKAAPAAVSDEKAQPKGDAAAVSDEKAQPKGDADKPGSDK